MLHYGKLRGLNFLSESNEPTEITIVLQSNLIIYTYLSYHVTVTGLII